MSWSLVAQEQIQHCPCELFKSWASNLTPWASGSTSVKRGWDYLTVLFWSLNSLISGKHLEQCLPMRKMLPTICALEVEPSPSFSTCYSFSFISFGEPAPPELSIPQVCMDLAPPSGNSSQPARATVIGSVKGTWPKLVQWDCLPLGKGKFTTSYRALCGPTPWCARSLLSLFLLWAHGLLVCSLSKT